MKLLTLNCHSLLSPAYSRDCENFVREVLRLRPDLIALQEVNQTRTAPPAAGDLAGWTPPAAGALLRADNHALRVARMLQEAGWPVHWTWTFAKIGYGRYEEGLALLSPGPLAQAEDWFITRSRDPENWKVRKALSARVALDGRPARCICVHMGWWGEEEEPFPAQWEQVEAGARQGEPCLVLGGPERPRGRAGRRLRLCHRPRLAGRPGPWPGSRKARGVSPASSQGGRTGWSSPSCGSTTS